MKYLQKVTWILVLFFLACDDDSNLTPNPSNPNVNNSGSSSGRIVAEFNGDKFEANTVGGSRIGGQIGITGLSNGLTLTISLTDSNAINYSLDQASLNAIAVTDGSGNDSYTSNRDSLSGGNVNITKIDEGNKTISGTFSSIVRKDDGSQIEITNGQIIDVGYATEINTGGGGNNSYSAKIDGMNWSATSVTGVITAGKLGLTGISNNPNQTILLFLPEGVSTGTFDLEFFGEYDAQYQTGSGQSALVRPVVNGSVTIQSHNVGKDISGTFFFDAGGVITMDTISITTGQFNVEY